MKKPTLRIDEVAREWDVSRRTVERLIQKGELPAFKIGDTTRIRSEDLKQFEEKKRPYPS